jgi:choline dehydrogenase-like flavoprotein
MSIAGSIVSALDQFDNWIARIHTDKMVNIRNRYDCIVVGTGPGGGPVARELAKNRRSVLIVEYGPKLNKTGFWNVAPKAFLDKSKKAFHSDGDIWFGRVRVLGGGSFVAMGNAASPPEKILNKWGLDLSTELQWARKFLRVNPMPEEFMGEGTKLINKAALSLGWEMKPTPKCVDFEKCTRCSFCMFGCPSGAKWSSVESIEEAISCGADLLLETEVTHILHANGRVKGISAIHNNEKITVEAVRVILSAGALSTPVILQRSGIPAGKGLAGDIFQTTYGYHPEVGMKGEIILATYLESVIEEKELFPAPYMYHPYIVQRDIDGGYPEKLGKLQQAKILMKSKKVDTSRLIGMMTKIRDERTGEVHGDGSIAKQLTPHDRAKLEEAHQINKKIMIAAGVKPESIFTGVYESGHPCCTAAIGEVVDKNQETDITGLYVSDASVFPSPLGIPPILTIVALSKRLANHLISS